MKHLLFLIILIIAGIMGSTYLRAEYELIELIPEFNYGSWYKSTTGYTPNPLWFGAWAIAPHNNALYLGFGTARPAESDGAILAKWDGDSLTPLGLFSEQGIHCLKWNQDVLYSIGSDPSMGDGWNGGNFYKYSKTEGFLKIRYNAKKKPVLPNVIHSWGLYIDTLDNSFLMATGSYDPVQYSKNGGNCGYPNDSTLACFGELWQSDDMGYNWKKISPPKPNVLSSFRVMDVIKFIGNIYVINANMEFPYTMKRSTDDGATWEEVPDVEPSVLYRMCIFQNKLIFSKNEAGTMQFIDVNDSISTVSMPGTFNYSFNVFANVEDRYLITYFSDGSIYATPDLSNWIELIPPNNKNFVSIAYWKEKKSVVLAERDSIGRIWKVDVSSLLATNVKEIPYKNKADIYETNDKIILNNPDANNTKIEIFNTLGMNLTKSVSIHKSGNSTIINKSSLNNGLYFVIYNFNGRYSYYKFIK